MQRFLTTLSALAIAGAAIGQTEPATQPAEPTPASAPMVDVAFPDDSAQAAADLLTGTWQGTSAIDDTGASLVMSIAPVSIDGLEGTLFAEMARSDDPANPFRQVVMQLYRYQDTLRLRTLEFRGDLGPVLTGVSYVPERFPETVTSADLIATIDIDLTEDGGGFSGSTPYAYPTSTGGAVQMTSTIEIGSDQITTGDTGYAADGSVAWGGADGAITFERADGLVNVERMESPDWSHQFIQIEYSQGEGEPVRDGDFLALHYTGLLTNGTKFDSSHDRGEPFRYRVPGQLIRGWLIGTEEIRQGGTKRLIIPPELGYGNRANARIPASSTLVFDVEAVYIERAEEPGENPAEAEAMDKNDDE